MSYAKNLRQNRSIRATRRAEVRQRRALAGITEIAQMLGVSRQRASQLVASKDFPEPLDRLAAGPVWRRQTVERWATKKGRALDNV